MSLLDRSKAAYRTAKVKVRQLPGRVKELPGDVSRHVRETKGGKLTLQALIAAAALGGAGEVGKYLWDVGWPMVVGIFEPSKKLVSVGGDWKGVYFSPSGHLPRRSGQENVALMCHEKGTQDWHISQRGTKFTAKISEPSTAKPNVILHWDASGDLKDKTDLVSTVVNDVGVNTVYLSYNADYGYYRGFAYLCDCHAPAQHAVMVCPYVLYKADDPSAASKADSDPLVAGQDQRCRTLPETGQTPEVPKLTSQGGPQCIP